MSARRLRRLGVLPSLLAGLLLPAVVPAVLAQSRATPAVAGAVQQRLVPFEVSINGTPGGSWLLLEREGALYAPAEAFDEWRLTRRASAQSISHIGKAWFALSALPGFEVRMNLAAQSVDLVFSPAAFTQSRIGEASAQERVQAVAATPALYVNFDGNLSHTRSRASGDATDVGVLGEVGFASELGVVTSSFVARHQPGSDFARRTLRRLETVYTRNFVGQGLTFRAGDSAARTGMLLRPFYFGGVEIGRNFALSPGFVTQPLPVLAGTAAAPSTVELYINDALRQTARVAPGPFVIDNYPLLTGSGQARIVVRDVLGRETVVVQPFLVNNNMLEEGLADWDLSAGAVRRDIAAESSGYDEAVASGYLRYGLSKRLTGELSLQLGRDRQAASVGLIAALPLQVLGSVGYATSHDATHGQGHRVMLAAEYSSLRHGFSLHMLGSTRRFTEHALARDALPTGREISASYTYGGSTLGSFGLGFARLAPFDREAVTTYTVNYSVEIASKANLSLSATHVKGQGGGTSVNASVSIPLDNQVNVSTVAARRAGSTEFFATASRVPGGEGGLAWRVLAGQRQSTAYAEGGASFEGTRARVSADMSGSSAQQALRFGAQGSVVYMDGGVHFARKLSNSFALVEVPGYPNVGIGLHGRVQARTDDAGKALLPGLMPFRANSIQLDPKELPISAEIDNIEQIIVPPERSGVKVTFPVRTGRGALIRIVFDDGEPAPAGAELQIVGDKQEFFVARRGEAFVTGLQPKSELSLRWKGASCRLAVELPAGSADEIARVGPVRCSGVSR